MNAIIDWCLYRAFSRDTESSTSQTHALRHYNAFYARFQKAPPAKQQEAA